MKQSIPSLDLPKSKMLKLRNMGYTNVNELNSTLLNSLEIELKKPPVTKTSLELLEEEILNGCILTFNTDLDQILKDEIMPRKIVELAGVPGSGKTQISFQLCITVQLPKALGGLEGEAIYISTNNNMAPHRIEEMSEKFIKQVKDVVPGLKLSADYILKHIYVIFCNNFTELKACIKYFANFLLDKKVKLIVIDSIATPLRELNQEDRTNSLQSLLSDLQSLSNLFNFAIIITNDFTTRIKGGQSYYTPSFGDSLFHRVNTRICLSKENSVHYAELVKSIMKPPTKVSFSVF
ncbi:DNA repair protein RAD51 homolog 3 [Sitophilus oryzae]|uniref:DNA repair protein RAD51 homolog 3 n=1 Tax=Sitophilus oryzae TaxID=7048 RepID=A0A6J2YT10_SITOR|nr:DNA repair protein RAD51 homolog 3 [Sitophilus oryzae]